MIRIRDKEKLREYAKKYYLANRQEMINRAIQHRKDTKKKIIDYKKKHPCSCGEDHPAALDFHHCNGKKEFCISDGITNGYAWSRIEAELLKCVVICRNCHAKLHWSDSWDDIFIVAFDPLLREDQRKQKGKPGYWKGRKLSEETKNKMSAAKKGKKFTAEHREALSRSHTRKVSES